MLYTNVQGLANNFNQMQKIATTEKSEFFILTETHDITKDEITIQDYNTND